MATEEAPAEVQKVDPEVHRSAAPTTEAAEASKVVSWRVLGFGLNVEGKRKEISTSDDFQRVETRLGSLTRHFPVVPRSAWAREGEGTSARHTAASFSVPSPVKGIMQCVGNRPVSLVIC